MTRPTHPVELLCCGIATQEGWFDADPTVTPRARNNPGDIRWAHQLGASAPGYDGEGPPPVATCESAGHGVTILFRQVWLQVAEGQTARQIIAQWAPPTENDTNAYIDDVLKWTGLPADVPVLDLLPPLVQLNLS